MSMDAVHAALSRHRAAAEAALLTGAVRSLTKAPRVVEAPKAPEVTQATQAPPAKRKAAKRVPEPLAVPRTGTMHPPKGRLVCRALASIHATQHRDDGTSLVSLDDYPLLRVTLRTADYRYLVHSEFITGTRWLFEDGEVRAYRRLARGLVDRDHTYSVAALILGAQDGGVIHMEDCLDLRPERMRLERLGGH